MESSILAQKPVIEINGEFIIDLTYQNINYKEEPIIIQSLLVTEDTVMRPDILSKIAYGSTDNWDYILKFNGVSNPFSLYAGQILLIPDLGYMGRQMGNKSSIDKPSESVRNKYIDESKASKIDANKIVYDKMMSNMFNVSKYNLPPNVAEPGKTEIEVADGNIYLGGKHTGSKI